MTLGKWAASMFVLLAGAPAAAAPAMGDLVSNTPFTTAYGKAMKLGDLRGEVIVLTYWMTDCRACNSQIKLLDYYYRQRRDVGLRVLVVAPEELTNSEMRSYFKGRIIHPLAAIGDPFEPGRALPTTYVIDRTGKVRHAESGVLDIEQLNEILVPLLRQPQP